MRKITKRAGVMIGVAALGISGGVAWAAWSIIGTATATATAAEAHEITITAVADNGLVPGGAKDLVITTDNPNAFPVQITDWGTTNTVSDKGGCAGTWVTFAPPANPVVIPAGPGSQTVIKGASMHINTPDECQGAKFTLTAEHVKGLSMAP
ncbi:MAG TPA: hypothetical protein VK659_14060 [Asanoa sp.]|nr:hypothetical protein [Asanoa sp.]